MKQTKKKGRGKAPEIGQPLPVAQRSPSIFVTSDDAKSKIWGIYSRPANAARPFRLFAILDTREDAIAHAKKIQNTACLGRDLAVIGAGGEKSIPVEFTENSALRSLVP